MRYKSIVLQCSTALSDLSKQNLYFAGSKKIWEGSIYSFSWDPVNKFCDKKTAFLLWLSFFWLSGINLASLTFWIVASSRKSGVSLKDAWRSQKKVRFKTNNGITRPYMDESSIDLGILLSELLKWFAYISVSKYFVTWGSLWPPFCVMDMGNFPAFF